jgi:hypothetical protein
MFKVTILIYIIEYFAHKKDTIYIYTYSSSALSEDNLIQQCNKMITVTAFSHFSLNHGIKKRNEGRRGVGGEDLFIIDRRRSFLQI